MRVFKPTRKDTLGATVPYSRWYVEIRDHLERVRRMAAFSDHGASEQLLRKLERLVMLRAVGERPDRELARFLEGLPDRMRGKLAEWGLVEAHALVGSRPLSALLDLFEESLVTAGRTAKHIQLVVGRARSAFTAAGFKTWSDIDAGRLARHLHDRREAGLSIRTSNHILAACKEFTGWAVRGGLASTDHLAVLRAQNARTDPRRERRALSWDDELPRLVRAAASGPEHRGVPGPVRALVYRLAAETGLRLGELTRLRARDFELAGERPTVTVTAASAKNRWERTLPLLPELAAEVSTHLRGRMPQAIAFPLPRSFRDKATRWLRFDLEVAGLPCQDDAGRFADFHALRASFVSGLIRSGASPKVVQSLARHSSAEMTLGVYTKLGRDDERDALTLLPALPTCTPDEACEERATGTDGTPENVASSVAFDPASQCVSVQSSATPIATRDPEKATEAPGTGGGGGSRTRVPEPSRSERLRA